MKRKIRAAGNKTASQNTGKKKSTGGSSALIVALRLAAQDMTVAPLYRKVGGRCACSNEDCERPGRHARIPLADASNAVDEDIKGWWKKWPDAVPGIVIDELRIIIAVASEGAAGRATEQKLREQKKTFTKTITIRDGERTTRLYEYLGKVHGTELGDGLRVLGNREIIRAPTRLKGGQTVRFRDGRAPGECKLARARAWLVHQITIPSASLFEEGVVRVDDVLTARNHGDVEEEVASSIAESPIGPFNPIIVRRIPGDRKGKVELIDGEQRLEAARIRGMETIRCLYFTGSDTTARMVRIEADAFRKRSTVLRKAELLAEYAELIQQTGYYISGQVGRKKRGRPPSYVLELPLKGRSREARRHIFKRASKIAAISQEAKDIATAGGLANNQTKLMEIAAAGPGKEVKKAKELVSQRQEQRRQPGKAPLPGLAERPQRRQGAHKSPPLQPDADRQAAADGEGTEEESASRQVPKDTTFGEIDNVWKRMGGPNLWKYAPLSVRTQFKEKLDRAPYAAKSDVVGFIEKVFFGRKDDVRQLYAYAKTQGIRRKVLPINLRALGYKLSKHGPASAAPRFYNNSKWKQQLQVITDAELEAPLAAEQKETSVEQQAEFGADRSRYDYYSDDKSDGADGYGDEDYYFDFDI
jgi:hypothetical protein